MKNPLHRFTLLVLLFCGVITTSCSSDDDDTVPALSNELEYKSTSYALKTGGYTDMAMYDENNEESTVMTGRGFLIFDQSLTSTDDAKVGLFLSLYSPGSSVFKTGTFAYVPYETLSNDVSSLTDTQLSTKYNNQLIYSDSYLFFDSNEDGIIELPEESPEIVSGSIKVSGTEPNYTVECDVTLNNGETVKAHYSGMFIDISDVEISEGRKRTSIFNTYSNLFGKLHSK